MEAAADQARVAEYIRFLRWQADRAMRSAADSGKRPWRFTFLEYFGTADIRASRDPAGMEVKGAEATVGGEGRPALWQHPPVSGESVTEFHVPVPSGLRDLRLRFAVGIRDGARATDRLVAFRIRVDGWQVWSHAGWPTSWRAGSGASDAPWPRRSGASVRKPASRAMTLSSTVRSAISLTSSSKRRRTKFGWLRERMISGPRLPLSTATT